jgi:hypothetical protein
VVLVADSGSNPRESRFLSPEEREQQELESRTHFRANPLPVHVLEGSSSAPSAPIFKRPPTEPQVSHFVVFFVILQCV